MKFFGKKNKNKVQEQQQQHVAVERAPKKATAPNNKRQTETVVKYVGDEKHITTNKYDPFLGRHTSQTTVVKLTREEMEELGIITPATKKAFSPSPLQQNNHYNTSTMSIFTSNDHHNDHFGGGDGGDDHGDEHSMAGYSIAGYSIGEFSDILPPPVMKEEHSRAGGGGSSSSKYQPPMAPSTLLSSGPVDIDEEDDEDDEEEASQNSESTPSSGSESKSRRSEQQPKQQQNNDEMISRTSGASAASSAAPSTATTPIVETPTTTTTTTTTATTTVTPPEPVVVVVDEREVQIEVTRELVKKFISDIWNRGEVELIPTVCHPSLRFNGHVGMDRVGHEGFARMVTTVREALSDYHCEIHSMVVETNKAFCRLRFTGKHTGNLLGYPPTGKTVAWMGASEFTCKNGKILKVWELGDLKSLEEQLKSDS